MKEFCYDVHTWEKRLHFITEKHMLTSCFEKGDDQSALKQEEMTGCIGP